MASRAKFKIDDRGIKQILFSDAFADVSREGAERVADAARAIAPVETGAYRDSIRVEEDFTDRVVYRVVADVPYALKVEADHGTLTQAMLREAD